MLDNLLRKYNSVLLDKEAIKREKGRLDQENADLRSILTGRLPARCSLAVASGSAP